MQKTSIKVSKRCKKKTADITVANALKDIIIVDNNTSLQSSSPLGVKLKHPKAQKTPLTPLKVSYQLTCRAYFETELIHINTQVVTGKTL